jgi:TatD DNase family protein
LNFEFGGVVTFARDYDEQIKSISVDRILTETDAPYVSPEPYRGQRNEPAYVSEVVKKLAEIKGISYDEMVKVTEDNARRIFKIPS